MYMYNYLEAVINDAKQAILENMNDWNFSDRNELEEVANDNLWTDDSVTGNASGSYTFSTWQAEENLCHNMDELEKACDEFGQDIGEAVKQGAEYCDVTIRCYLLGQAISAALDELEEKGKIQYKEEEEN
nr:MAG TPA: Transcription initiation factor IIA, gamma subunit, helical domain [Caudoviricetes sp.]